MTKSKKHWKKRRGKLGILAPLIGNWKAEADSPMGPVVCTRKFMEILDGAWLQLTADWEVGKKTYQEQAIIGVDSDGVISFWSFTSDGKNSTGKLADVSDVHPEAIGFEAQMPAGLARMIYWPDEEAGFYWAVESQTKKGWNRFTEHHYRSIPCGDHEVKVDVCRMRQKVRL